MSVYEDVWHASYDQGLDFAGNRPHLHRIHNHCRLLDFCVAHIVSVSSLLSELGTGHFLAKSV